MLTIGLNRAVALIADAAAEGKGKAARTSAPIKVLGEHPEHGGKVEVLSGRFGPYIKFGKVNATVPKSMAPEAVTMEDAVKLIAARMESGGGKKKPAGKAKAAKTKAATGPANGGKKAKAPRKTATKAASEAT